MLKGAGGCPKAFLHFQFPLNVNKPHKKTYKMTCSFLNYLLCYINGSEIESYRNYNVRQMRFSDIITTLVHSFNSVMQIEHSINCGAQYIQCSV